MRFRRSEQEIAAVLERTGWKDVCRCARCTYPWYRALYYWRLRRIQDWHWLVTCRVKGHDAPDPNVYPVVSWKTWCRRCLRVP